MKTIIIFLTALIIGNWMGFISAHNNIAIECETLSRFYVRHKIYSCERENKKIVTINLQAKEDN